jgi:imidazolonepropionase-like amidohydrolase
MQKNMLFFLFLAAASGAGAQTTFLLHKFAQNIGKETYTVGKNGNTVTYDINFKFVDRGAPVPLKAQLVTDNAYAPVSLYIKGNTSRFSTINDSIRIQDKKVSIKVGDSIHVQKMARNTFPVAGYSPATVQMVLLQYWLKNNQPQSIKLLPAGEVRIFSQGYDTLSYTGKALVLRKFLIRGLIWGDERAWADLEGNLVCLITIDAEGDKLEIMLEAYESLLPQLISKAASDGMKYYSRPLVKLQKMMPAAVLAVVGGNVVDVEGNASIDNAVVIIENGLIRELGKAGSIPIPKNAKVIHAEGKTILPGLWDMHAHFQEAEWGPTYLASGVTTVRDCGNEFEYINTIKTAIDSGKGIGPFILKAGLIDGPGPTGLGIVRAATPEEAVRAVRMYKDNGYAQIKIYSAVQPAIVKAISDEAHRLGLSVTGHVPDGMTTFAGIDSGMDQVNHMQYIYAMMKKKADKSVDLQDPANIAALDYLKAHNVVVDPTVGVFEMVFRSVKDDITQMEPNFYKLPDPLQALFKTMGMPARDAARYAPMFQSMLAMVKALHEKGVTIVAGTDMGFPGYSLARELELYVQAGLTPLQAIQTATIVPAGVMHMSSRAGSIAPGKQADLVIISGNPLKNIRDIRNVWRVIKAGQEYDPAELHRMVGFKE